MLLVHVHICNTFTPQLKGNHWNISHAYLINDSSVTTEYKLKCNTGTYIVRGYQSIRLLI